MFASFRQWLQNGNNAHALFHVCAVHADGLELVDSAAFDLGDYFQIVGECGFHYVQTEAVKAVGVADAAMPGPFPIGNAG